MTKPHQPWFIRRPMPEAIHRVHLIGIAGAGMGAFACMLQDRGLTVRGSDHNVYPPMSDILTARRIPWMEGFAAEHLDWGPDLVIVGNVCRRDNPEAVRAESLGIAVSFPQAFADLFLADRRSVVIAGTHGKTTTTALTAWLLHACGLRPGLLVGGVSRNFDATYLLQGGAGDPFVVEGDEYDTAYFDKGPKFLHYRPQIAVLNNIEFDHADIYDDLDEIIENFDRLMDQLGEGSLLLANGDDPHVEARASRARGRILRYGLSPGLPTGPGNDLWACDITPHAAGCRFTLMGAGPPTPVESPLAGRHNVYNTLAALAIGLELGAPLADLLAALRDFQGVKKRQEERGEAAGVLIIDDYAHHPTAIRETLAALRARYPGRRLWAVYEPKSNTARRNIHQRDYAEAFAGVDQVLLARPFLKRDDFGQDERLDLERLVADLQAGGTAARHTPSVDAAFDLLLTETRPGDAVVFMSSSGFEGIHTRLLDALRARET